MTEKDRPTQPPEANGKEDLTDEDPMLHAPGWARHLDQRMERVAQQLSDHSIREESILSALRSSVQAVTNNQSEILSLHHKLEQMLLRHDVKIADHEARIAQLERECLGDKEKKG